MNITNLASGMPAGVPGRAAAFKRAPQSHEGASVLVEVGEATARHPRLEAARCGPLARGAGIAVLVLACAARFAHATDITVTTTSDTAAADGRISLREAVEAINGQASYYEAPAG